MISFSRRAAALILLTSAICVGELHAQPHAAVSPASPRIVENLVRDWTFQYFPAAARDPHWGDPSAYDRPWPAIALPHTWSTYETTRELHPFIRHATEREDSYWWYGWGWYRKHLRLARTLSNREVSLEFDGVQKVAFIYVNGHLAGEHHGGYTSFSVDITPWLRFGHDNLIAVEVSNRRDDDLGHVPPMTAGNFDVYGGIYRSVRLVLTNKVHVPFQGSASSEGGLFIHTPQVSRDLATVNATEWVRNDNTTPAHVEVRARIVDPHGNIIGQSTTERTIAPGELASVDHTFAPIHSPQLWSPSTPNLYRMQTEVLVAGRIVDRFDSTFGLRFFRWDHAARKLYLNGQPIQLIGTNRHQDFPWLGDAVPFWLQQRDLMDMRSNLGFNFQRTAHYPEDPAVYDFCDHHGILVLEESPNIKDIAFGRDVQEQTMREMIRRDRNHPSIISWGIGNETDHPADSLWAHQEDTSRLINLRRGTNGGDFVTTTDADMGLEQTLRCTIRGWYNEDAHDFTPGTGEPVSGQVAGTEEWQHTTDAKYLLSHAGTNIVVFLYADHGADRVYRNAPLMYVNPKGWVDGLRFPKYVYYLWQANFTTKPMVFIHPWPWQQRYIGSRQDITIDSNGDEVELFMNGHSLGVRATKPGNAHLAVFPQVPIEQGELRAVSHGPAGTSEQILRMAGPPRHLVLHVRNAGLPADRSGIAVIEVSAVDAQGNPVEYIHPALRWAVDGPATLVGPANYASDRDKNGAGDGTMYIDLPTANLIRTTTVAGAIHVRVSSPGLQDGELELHSESPVPNAEHGIVQPVLSDSGRAPVSRDIAFHPATETAVARTFDHIGQDEQLPAHTLDEARESINKFLNEHDPRLSRSDRAYADLVSRLGQLLYDNHGNLIADWYNFTSDRYEAFAFLRHEIEQSPRSPRYKRELEDSLADRFLLNDEPINASTKAASLRNLLRGGKELGWKELIPNKDLSTDTMLRLYPDSAQWTPAIQWRALSIVRELNPAQSPDDKTPLYVPAQEVLHIAAASEVNP